MDYDEKDEKILRWIGVTIMVVLMIALCIGNSNTRKQVDLVSRQLDSISDRQSLIISMLDSITSTECKELDNIKRMTFTSKSPKEGLMEALRYYGVKYPEWVYCQAVLETNLGKVGVGRYNNLFGMKVSPRRYKHFDHWWESIPWYMSKVQYKFNPKIDKDYPSFLRRIGYAEDPAYIRKLTNIHSKLFDND